MKKILKSLLWILVLAALCIPLSMKTEAAASGKAGANITWTLYDNGVLSIYGTGNMYNYSEGEAPWYDVRSRVYTVEIAGGVTSVGSYAFYDCYYMGSIYIYDSVKIIGEGAFCSCVGLTGVYLFGDDLQTIGDYAFRSCSNLAVVNIPYGVQTIGESAFQYCSGLTTVSLENGLKEIKKTAFYGCTSISKVEYAGTQTQWASVFVASGNQSLIDALEYRPITGIRIKQMPNKTVYLPNETLDTTGLRVEAVYSDETTVEIQDFEVSGFSSDTAGTKTVAVTWRDFATSFTVSVLDATTGGTAGENVTWALDGNGVLTISGTGVMPDYFSYTDVSEAPWYGLHESILKVVIEDGVESVSNSAFCGCEKLTSVTIPDSVQTIDDHAFRSCADLKTVTLGTGLKKIGDGAFYQCTSLSKVQYAGTRVQWNSIVIGEDNESLTDVAPMMLAGIRITAMPNKMTYLMDETLDTTGLQVEIFYNDGVSEAVSGFKVSGFSSKTAGAKTVTVTYGTVSTTFTVSVLDMFGSGTAGDNITWVLDGSGTLTFSGSGHMFDYDSFFADRTPWYGFRDSILKVVIEDGITYVGVNAFYNYKKLTSVTIPDSVQTIGDKAFNNCTGLKTVTLGSGLETIGASAFSGCSNIDVVRHTGTQEQWNSVSIKSGNDNLTTAKHLWVEPDRWLTDIRIAALPNKTAYLWGETLNTTGLQIEGTYNDGTTAVFSSGFKFSGFSSNTAGVKTVTVTYRGCTATFTVTVSDFIKNGTAGDNVTWSLVNGILTISGTGVMDDFYAATDDESNAPWDNYRWKILEVVIEDGVTSVGNYAFYNYENLTSVTIPDSVQTIGECAFFSCDSLKTVTLGSGLKSIKKWAFHVCSNINVVRHTGTLAQWNSVTIGSYNECLTSSNHWWFDQGKWLTGIRIAAKPDKTEYFLNETLDTTGLQVEAVYSDGTTRAISNFVVSSLSSTTAGDKTVTVTYGAVSTTFTVSVLNMFGGGAAGENITWKLDSKGVLTISGTGSMPNYADTYKVPWYSKRENVLKVAIEDGVTSVGSYAFYNCACLTSVAIPDSVQTISNNAFGNCTSLSTVEYTGTQTQWNSIAIGSGNECLTGAVLPALPTGIRFTALPGKSEYLLNETLDTKGLQVQAVYSDGTAKVISDFEISGFSSSTVGEKTVTVTWQGFTATFTVTVLDAPTGENITWTLDDAGVLTISGTGAMKKYTSASVVPWYGKRGYILKIVIEDGVTSVGDYAFYGCTALTSVTLPDSVESIGKYAFYNCYQMKEITIPDSVKSIGESAFRSCVRLVSVDFGSGVQTIGAYAFRSCSNLISVNLPESLETIDTEAFYNCSALKEIIIPDGVSTIGTFAFESCTSLASLDLGSGVQTIGAYAFRFCESLPSVILPESVQIIGKDTFYGCSALKEVIIPESVQTIEGYAFWCCSGLTTVTLGKGVKTIEGNAFGNCTSLSKVQYTGTQAQWESISIGSNNECLTRASRVYRFGEPIMGIRVKQMPNKRMYLLNAALDITGLQVEAVYSDETSEVISAGFEISGFSSDSVGEKTVTVTYENFTATFTVSVIDAIALGTAGKNITWTFDKAGVLTVFGTGVMTNYTKASAVPWYSNCTSILQVVIDDGVTSVGDYAFYGCTALTSVTLPDSVEKIGKYAFYKCTSLSKVQYTGTKTQWNRISIGSNNGSLTGASRVYRFGEPIMGICITALPGKKAYLLNETLDTTGLQVEAVYSDEATEVISSGFEISGFSSDSVGEKTVTVTYEGYTATFTVSVIDAIALGTAGKNITWILDKAGVLTISGTGAMTNYTKASAVPWNSKCTSITKVVIEDGVQSVGDYAFYGCTALTAVTIPDGVETVGDYAFYNCTGLTAVTLSDSVEEIGNYAFYNCYLMKELTIPGSVKTIGASAFRSCVRLVSVDFGNGVQTIGGYAFRSCTKLATVTIPKSMETIKNNAFENCTSLSKVQYTGTQAQWNSISIGGGNEYLTGASREYRFGISIAGIRITETPDKTAYLLNETLDTTGLQVEVVYSDGATEVITNFEISGYGSDTAGEKTVTVAYKGFTDSFTVSVFDYLSGTAGENVTWELGIDGVLTVSGSGTMTDYTEASQAPWYDVRKSVLQVVIEDGVQSIGTEAFNGCTKLTSVSLGKGLQSIGARAFYGCNALTEVVYTGTSKQWSAVTIGTGNTKLADVECLGVITEIRIAALPDRTEYDVSEKLDITGLQVEIVYADGTTYIISTGFEVPAFTGVSPGTKTITVTYEGFTTTFTVEYKKVMWSYTVSDDGKVTITGVLDKRQVLDIPATIGGRPVVAIADKAFYGNQNITQVIIPEGVETIGDQAFYNCAYLTSVTLSDSVKTMGESVFRSCVRLKSVDLGNGLQAIGDYAFRSCSNLTEVIMGDGVQTIGTEAFIYCKNLAEITLGDNVATIGDNAFMYCIKLKTVDLGESVKNIGHSAFRNCVSLETVVLPKTVSSLDAYAFAGCTELSCITIPVKVTAIDEWIFGGCNNLKYVLYGGTEAKRKEMLIDGMNEALFDATWFYNVSAEEEVSLLGIQIVAMPDKTEYAAGEALDVTGLQLEAVYSNGTVKTVSDGFETSGFSSDAAGEQTVTVTYEGVTTTFTVSVTEDVACGQIVVDTSTATAGKTVKVTIALKGNPGLVSALMRVNFDANVLTLTEVTDGGILGVTSHKPTFSCPYTLSWVNDTATTDFTADGIIVTLTFTVAEDAEPGNYPITVSYDYDGYDICNANAQKVKFTAVNGGVQVLGYIAGDVNDDGAVNTLDRLALTRYLAGWDGYDEDTLNLDAADVNGDGAVNNFDRTVLTRYLADWDGYETLPYTG